MADEQPTGNINLTSYLQSPVLDTVNLACTMPSYFSSAYELFICGLDAGIMITEFFCSQLFVSKDLTIIPSALVTVVKTFTYLFAILQCTFGHSCLKHVNSQN